MADSRFQIRQIPDSRGRGILPVRLCHTKGSGICLNLRSGRGYGGEARKDVISSRIRILRSHVRAGTVSVIMIRVRVDSTGGRSWPVTRENVRGLARRGTCSRRSADRSRPASLMGLALGAGMAWSSGLGSQGHRRPCRGGRLRRGHPGGVRGPEPGRVAARATRCRSRHRSWRRRPSPSPRARPGSGTPGSTRMMRSSRRRHPRRRLHRRSRRRGNALASSRA